MPPSTQPIPVGLIGVGKHGQRYLHHLLTESTGLRLVAISRAQAQEGQQLANTHSLRFYADWRDLIADSSIQAVIIVTPPSLHLPMVLEAIQGKKAILVEKPLALDAAQGRQMVNAASQSNIPLMTAQTLRYEPLIQTLGHIRPQLGELLYMSGVMRLEDTPHTSSIPASPLPSRPWVGAVLELGIHLFDLTRFLLQDEVDCVTADLLRSAAHHPEHRAWIRLGTRKGCEAQLEVSRVPKGRVTRIELIGSKGQALADWTQEEVTILGGGKQRHSYPCPSRPTLIPLLNDFARSLKDEILIPISGQEGLHALEIADACYRSEQTQGHVHLEHV